MRCEEEQEHRMKTRAEEQVVEFSLLGSTPGSLFCVVLNGERAGSSYICRTRPDPSANRKYGKIYNEIYKRKEKAKRNRNLANGAAYHDLIMILIEATVAQERRAVLSHRKEAYIVHCWNTSRERFLFGSYEFHDCSHGHGRTMIEKITLTSLNICWNEFIVSIFEWSKCVMSQLFCVAYRLASRLLFISQ
jgi:hypothetical protein